MSFALANKEDRNSLSPKQAIEIVENLNVLDPAALVSDVELTRAIVNLKRPGSDAALGFPLISSRSQCIKCDSKLYTRKDRASTVVVHHDQLGTISSTHYTRYCRKRNCSYQQHYGYYTEGDSKKNAV